MKVSTERLENCQVVLNIETEPHEVERSLEVAYRHLVKRTSVPGFRKGKAPRALLERHLGREAILGEALEHLIPEAYNQAIQEQGIDAIAQPEIEIIQTDPVVFKATVAVRPTVELGDYRQIRLTPEGVEVGEEQIDEVVEQIRHQHAIWEPVERAVSFGDLVTIDVECSINGKPFLAQKGAQYHVIQDSPSPVPGFAEKLVGMEKGEKEFTISFPPDYAISELAGKEYLFKVLLAEVKEKRLPELGDDFAKGVGEGFETVELLRKRIAADLKSRAEEIAKRRFEERVVEKVIDDAKLEFPPILVEREIDRLIAERVESRIGLDDYLRGVKMTREELRDELRPLATKRVTRSLVLGKVAEEEKMEVGAAEIDAEIEAMAKRAGEQADEIRRIFSSPSSRQSLERMLIARKTVERLVAIASGGEKGGE